MKEILNLLTELKWVTLENVETTLLKEKYANTNVKEFLFEILKSEVEFKLKRRELLKVRTGGFGRIKTIEEFDFNFQPQINKNLIDYLLTFRFIDKNENVVFFGSPGVGKTHLATAIGIEAAKSQHSVYFIDCHKLLNNLKEAKNKNQLANRIKHYSKYKLLIIDELGFLPMDEEMANIMFQLVNSRYLKKSTIITTNKPFSEWGKMFCDETIASAILDRLLHKSHVITINGKSYRTYESLSEKDKLNESIN